MLCAILATGQAGSVRNCSNWQCHFSLMIARNAVYALLAVVISLNVLVPSGHYSNFCSRATALTKALAL
jgi:hypothetical protein